jgi:branched-chain amino acid transport system permease protein
MAVATPPAATSSAKVLVEGTSAHRTYKLSTKLLAGLILVAIPFIKFPSAFGNPVGQMQNWNRTLAFAVALVGLNLLIGFSGQISIGHSAFVGLGAYATIVLVATHHWSYFAALPIAFLLPFIAGCIVGLPALRIKGLYLVVVTFAMAISFPTIILRYESITGGSNGKGASGTLEPPAWTPFDTPERVDPHRYRYFVLLAVTGLMFFLAHNMIASRAGRALIAQRDNPIAATVSGVSVAQNKVLMFGVSSGFCGVAGWMLMVNTPFAADTSFTVAVGITLIIGLVIGGAATLAGAIPGALVVVVLQYLLESLTEKEKFGPVSMHWLGTRQGKGGIVTVALGVLLLASVFVLPGGIIDGLRRLRTKVVRTAPNPKWLSEVSANPVTTTR